MSNPTLDCIDYWEVGQGDCTVLRFTDGSVLLIDTGLRGSPVVDWLADRPRVIRAIVLTHNDGDHAGALCGLVQAHKRTIGGIYLLLDRPKNDPVFQKLFRCALEGERQGCYQITRLECPDIIWENGLTKLCVVHPSFSENIEAGTPNAASAMVVLEHDGKWLAVWPGDMPLAALSAKAEGRKPTVLMGPHHGAPAGYKVKPHALAQVQAISPERNYISVGTKNTYDHPRPGYLQRLVRSGCHVVCSQLTRACDPRVKGMDRPVFNGTGMLGLRAPRTGISCRGSWRVQFHDGSLVAAAYDQMHLHQVAKLRRPQCRLRT